MARIEWVKDRLDNWARWSAKRVAGAQGYPRQSVFTRLAGKGTRAEAVVPIDDVDASITDDAVQALRWDKPHLYLTLVHVYLDGWDIKRVARQLVKAESTIKAQLEQADHALAGWFRARDERQRAARQAVHAGVRGGSTT